jgi:DNA-binding NarL/FixJ family response regulator
MARLLGVGHGLHIAGVAGSANEALELSKNIKFDVALLDIALGRDSATGLELAFALRRTSPNIGIVFFSQHANIAQINGSPLKELASWSIVQKSAMTSTDFLAEVLRSTARGLSVIDPSISMVASRPDEVSEQLTPRQREIMGLLASGLDANSIAVNVSLSPVTVRQELSKIYKLLVPNPAAGTDLRTSAVLRYLRETRSYDWSRID